MMIGAIDRSIEGLDGGGAIARWETLEAKTSRAPRKSEWDGAKKGDFGQSV
jgi:hypothetical protein